MKSGSTCSRSSMRTPESVAGVPIANYHERAQMSGTQAQIEGLYAKNRALKAQLIRAQVKSMTDDEVLNFDERASADSPATGDCHNLVTQPLVCHQSEFAASQTSSKNYHDARRSQRSVHFICLESREEAVGRGGGGEGGPRSLPRPRPRPRPCQIQTLPIPGPALP